MIGLDPVHESLLLAVLGDPDDRIAFQALGDWCEENGHHRPFNEITTTQKMFLSDGFAARLFRIQPITRVNLQDKEPGKSEWRFWNPILGDFDRTIPACIWSDDGPWNYNLDERLWRLLHDGDRASAPTRTTGREECRYREKEYAVAALNRACVRWGRLQAGWRILWPGSSCVSYSTHETPPEDFAHWDDLSWYNRQQFYRKAAFRMA